MFQKLPARSGSPTHFKNKSDLKFGLFLRLIPVVCIWENFHEKTRLCCKSDEHEAEESWRPMGKGWRQVILYRQRIPVDEVVNVSGDIVWDSGIVVLFRKYLLHALSAPREVACHIKHRVIPHDLLVTLWRQGNIGAVT